MSRGIASFVALAALGCVTPSVWGQYPYPYAPQPYYGPMPVQYMKAPAGYPPTPMARPVYLPASMMRPVMPHWPHQPRTLPPRVHYFGPLTESPETPQPAVEPSAPSQLPKPHAAVKPAPSSSGAEVLPEASGPCTDPLGCPPFIEPACPTRYRGRGHFIGEVGAYFLVPRRTVETSFTTVNAGGATENEFPDVMHFGPRGSVGYICHSGWGVRGSYWFLDGDASAATANADPTAGIITPGAGLLTIAGLSPSLAAGLGVDQYAFEQGLNVHIADIEVVRETSILHTSFLFGGGVRYGRIRNTYEAQRTNAGGTAGGTVFTLDRQTAAASSRFAGFGPTLSLDFVHPMTRWGLGLYGNVRGSWLIGTNRFAQSLATEQRSVTGGIDTSINNVAELVAYDQRNAAMLDTELGLQLGCRVGRCYVFGRAGGVYQHWWNVGAPTSAGGDMRLIGGTAVLGVTY